jgi:hypothetical protein
LSVRISLFDGPVARRLFPPQDRTRAQHSQSLRPFKFDIQRRELMRRACQKCLFGSTHWNFGFQAALRVITGLTALATMGNISDILELNNGELCVLRWLRISGGKATLSTNAVAGNSLFVVPAPLLKAGLC